MTNQEAIKCIKLIHCNGCEFKDENECKHCFYGMSIEALKRENVLDQIRWERDIAINQLEEIGLSLGEKTDKVREAVDKQNAKKPIFDKPLMVLECPTCGNYLQTVVDSDGYTKGFIPCYCKDCGQKIDAAWM